MARQIAIEQVNGMSMSSKSPAIFDEQKFMKQMVGTHSSDEGEVDVQSLFALVGNLLQGAIGVVDNVVKPKGGASEGPSGNAEFTIPGQGSNPPVSAISKIGCLITCQALDTKNVTGTMKVIFSELSSYSWVAKSVITLAALALHYAEFWHLDRIQQSDKVAETMATLKGLPAIKTQLSNSSKNQVFIKLNEMIKSTLDMTKCIVDFEDEREDVPELSESIDIPDSVYKIIFSVLACSIQFTSVISLVDGYSGRVLPKFVSKVKDNHAKITRQWEEFKQKKDEIMERRRLAVIFHSSSSNVKLIKAFFDIKHNSQPLFNGSKGTMDKVESLHEKHVLLLISDLKLAPHDLKILGKIYKECDFRKNLYEILWIPIVEGEYENQFTLLRAQMPWYSISSPETVNKIAIEIIEENWHFRKDTLAVLLDPQGKVENENAMHLIRTWECDAFPFTSKREADLWNEHHNSWFQLLVTNTSFREIQDAIKKEKFIFLYGQEDCEAIVDIRNHLEKIKQGGVPIVFHDVSKSQEFWSCLEDCYCMLFKLKIEAHIRDPLMQDILMLYTNFKKDGGFAVLTKGSCVVINGLLAIATQVLAQHELESWKKQVSNMGFDGAFKKSYGDISKKDSTKCCHLSIPNMQGYIPKYVKCPAPGCDRMMRNIVKFECCHVD